MTVTLLGTGSPIPSADRFGNSTLVEVPGLRLVFDLGRGAPIRLWQKQIPLGTINAHFLTHLHSDHVNGLPRPVDERLDPDPLRQQEDPVRHLRSHIVLSGLPSEGIPFPTPADLLAATGTTYDGPVVVGSDLMAFKIDESGVSIVAGGGGAGAAGGSNGGASGTGGATGGASGAAGP